MIVYAVPRTEVYPCYWAQAGYPPVEVPPAGTGAVASAWPGEYQLPAEQWRPSDDRGQTMMPGEQVAAWPLQPPAVPGAGAAPPPPPGPPPPPAETRASDEAAAEAGAEQESGPGGWAQSQGPGSAQQRRHRRQRMQHPPVQHPERRPATGGAADTSLAADLLAKLNAGGDALTQAVATLRQPGVFRRLSFERAGCRAVQLALDVVDRRTAATLAAGLHGCVAEAVKSPHANYVLQKIIKVLTPQEVPFVVDELSAASLDIARHEYGCRIYCRLLEHAAADEHTAWLIDEVLLETEELVRHTFGHHVVECALEHGLPHQRHQIISTLRKDLMHNAGNRNAAYVVEKALLYGSPEDRQGLASDLVSHSSRDVVSLARNQFGSMVVRALLRQPGPSAQKLQEHLGSATAQLKATKHGRRLLDDHGLGSARGQAVQPGGS